MDLAALRLFQEVGHRLSFKTVADEHGINPSSVSRTIGQLEDQLGVRLLQRTTRRMALTESGALFLQRVSRILSEFEEACEEASMPASKPMGTLKLTTSVAFGEQVLVPLVPRFQQLYPDVRLELALTDSNLDLVANNVDLAIRFAPTIEGDVIVSKLFGTCYRVVASPDYLAKVKTISRPSDLIEHPCSVFTFPAFRSTWRFRDTDGHIESVAISNGLAISSAISLRSATLRGAGPALLADWLVGMDIADGSLIDLFPDHDVAATSFETAAWIVYPSRAYMPGKVRVMIDFLRETLG